MDKLVEHGIRMLEIVEGENDFFRNDAKRQADIARAVYDTILRVQALERKADRKTEPSDSEIPNNSTISKMEQVDEPQTMYYPQVDGITPSVIVKDEPKTQMKTQNSNLTFEKRTMRDCYNCERYETEDECIECHYEPKDECAKEYEELGLKELKELIKADRKTEPQTCSVNGRPYDCGNCEYFKCTADEPQTEVIMPKKCKGCDSASKIIEAYSKGFEDGADAVKALPQADCNGCKFVGTYDTEFPCVNCSRKTKDYYDKEEWYTYQDEQDYNDR